MCFARASLEWNLIDNETSYSEEKYKKELNGGERTSERKGKSEGIWKRAKDMWYKMNLSASEKSGNEYSLNFLKAELNSRNIIKLFPMLTALMMIYESICVWLHASLHFAFYLGMMQLNCVQLIHKF